MLNNKIPHTKSECDIPVPGIFSFLGCTETIGKKQTKYQIPNTKYHAMYQIPSTKHGKLAKGGNVNTTLKDCTFRAEK